MATDDLLIERLLRVIDEGRRTTYKLALLLGIIDTSATMPNETELPTRAIAERVLELYYPQTRSYVDRNGVTFMPRQISMKSSTVLAAVERLRVTGHAMRCRSIDEVARRAPRDYERALDVVEDTFVRYPIPSSRPSGRHRSRSSMPSTGRRARACSPSAPRGAPTRTSADSSTTVVSSSSTRS
ncbi:MAG: hypothetical protein R2713_14780 [Ilumatobacteraceae bacterium]